MVKKKTVKKKSPAPSKQQQQQKGQQNLQSSKEQEKEDDHRNENNLSTTLSDAGRRRSFVVGVKYDVPDEPQQQQTPSEDATKKTTCCSSACRLRLPLVPIRVIHVVLAILLLAGLTLFFYYFVEAPDVQVRDQNYKSNGFTLVAPPFVYEWTLFFGSALLMFVALLLLGQCSYVTFKRSSARSASLQRLVMWLKPSTLSLVVFIFSFCLFPLTRGLLQSLFAPSNLSVEGSLIYVRETIPPHSIKQYLVNGTIVEKIVASEFEHRILTAGSMRLYFDLTATALAVCAVCRALTVVAVQIAILANKQDFWKHIVRYVKREKIMEILAGPAKFVVPSASATSTSSRSGQQSASKRGVVGIQNLIGMVAGQQANSVFDSESSSDFLHLWDLILTRKVVGIQLPPLIGSRRKALQEVSEEVVANVTARDGKQPKRAAARAGFSLDHVRDFFQRRADAETAFHLFQPPSSSSSSSSASLVTVDQFKKVLADLLEEREQMYQKVAARESLGKLLRRLVNVVYCIVMMFVVLTIYQVPLEAILLPAGTALLAISFVFSNSLRMVWESFISVFVNRYFDVGDRIELPGLGIMVVKRIHLLTTEANHVDGRLIIVPNHKLLLADVISHRRSTHFRCTFELRIPASVPSSSIIKLQQGLEDWCLADESPWMVEDGITWVTGGSAVDGYLSFTVFINLKNVGWQKPPAYRLPRTRLRLALHDLMRELEIFNIPPVQQIQIVKKECEPSLESD